MKKTNVAVVALGAAAVAALLAYPAFAMTTPANASPTTGYGSAAASAPAFGAAMAAASDGMRFGPGSGPNGRGPFGDSHAGQTTTFTNGQKITLTSTKGECFVVGTKDETNGTASGTLTFTVTGKLTAGYILNMRGSLTVNGTTYNVTSGSAVMGPGGPGIHGQGATIS